MYDKLSAARQAARAATGIIALFLFLAFVYREAAVGYVKEHEATFKLIGLGIGPLLAALGFFWGLVDKAEIKNLSHELGRAEKASENKAREAAAAHDLASEARAAADAKEKHIAKLEDNLTKIADYSRLWSIRENRPFQDYRLWKRDPGAKIVTVSLFKGGRRKNPCRCEFRGLRKRKATKAGIAAGS